MKTVPVVTYLFKLDDRVEHVNPKHGYRYATIVDSIEANRKPDLFLIQKWKLFKMPLNKATCKRWVAKLDNSEHVIVFPENPIRIIGNTVHLAQDEKINKLTPIPLKKPLPDVRHPFMLN